MTRNQVFGYNDQYLITIDYLIHTGVLVEFFLPNYQTFLWWCPCPFINWGSIVFVVFKMVVCLVLLIFRLVIGVIKLNGTFKFSFFHSHHLDRWWKMVKIMTWQFHGKKSQNFTFIQKSIFHIFNHISGNIWATEMYNTSK